MPLTPGGSIAVTTDPEDALTPLTVDADGALAVSTGDPVAVSTPWTPLGNVAVAVDPDGNLAFLKTDAQGRLLIV